MSRTDPGFAFPVSTASRNDPSFPEVALCPRNAEITTRCLTRSRALARTFAISRVAGDRNPPDLLGGLEADVAVPSTHRDSIGQGHQKV
jgi:hypothetical protein